MPRNWSKEDVLEVARSFQPACALAAAGDWNVFTVLASSPITAEAVSLAVHANRRAMTILLDALVAMELLHKQQDVYSVPADVAEILTDSGHQSALPMIQHQANCLRRWAQLSEVIRSGKPADRSASIRGEQADQAAFIGAMHTVSGEIADALVAEIRPEPFHHLLDVGGASGTWTIALLKTSPDAKATLFDLPDVLPLAEKRIRAAGLSDRVRLASGDFYTDSLPDGADLVWISAIAHQNSRQQNRELFQKTYGALAAGGRVLIRDIVMNESHTQPPAGALFAVNMLVATEGGGTYSFREYREDLEAEGFKDVNLLRNDRWMNSVVQARKP